MDAFFSSQLFDKDYYTVKHLNILNNKVKINKAKIQKQYEARQKSYAEKKLLYQKRIADLAERRKTENTMKIIKNQALFDRFCFGSCSVKTKEFYRTLQLVTDMRNRDRRKAALLEQIKKNRPIIKQENALKRRTKILEKKYNENKLKREIWLAAKRNEIVEKPKVVEKEIPRGMCSYIEVTPPVFNIIFLFKYAPCFRTIMIYTYIHID